jgi:sortase (surface protein transpeptidase)
MKKITLIFILLIFSGIGFGFTAKHFLAASTTQKQVLLPTIVEITPTTTETVENKKQANLTSDIPQTLRIPKISLQAPIESVGLDTERKMDVPKNSDDVGWYDLQNKPGEPGNAVIDGHLDKASGAPAAFWNLHKLDVGDKIIVTDAKGNALTFSVIRKATYNYDTFPIAEVFGPSSKKLLNLISCAGAWDKTAHNYSERTVIYSQLDE